MIFRQSLISAAKEYGIVLSDTQIDAFQIYYNLLIEWNEKINLTAITDPHEVAIKHMIDSVTCLDPVYFPEGCSIIDVGTGAGFPGIPIKILRPDIKLTLLDSLQKRLKFLQEVLDNIKIGGVQLIHSRAEDAGQQKELRGKYQVAVSRAVARLNVLCEYCLPLVAVGGCFTALKGAQFQEELQDAKGAIAMLGGEIADVRNIKLPGLNDVRAIIYINKIKQTPTQFPRKAGLPEKKPL